MQWPLPRVCKISWRRAPGKWQASTSLSKSCLMAAIQVRCCQKHLSIGSSCSPDSVSTRRKSTPTTTGCASLGHLTGRRLAILVHLRGNDFRRKFDDVWVAQTSGIVRLGKSWQRIPVKNDASLSFFVLHGFLREIGFVDLAVRRKDAYIFPQLMALKDPSKGASAHMQRLFKKAGVASRKEVFHSLRGGNIEQMRLAKLEPRTIRMQAGHKIGVNEHELYGFRAIAESSAIEIAMIGHDPQTDYSVFRGLNFNKLAGSVPHRKQSVV